MNAIRMPSAMGAAIVAVAFVASPVSAAPRYVAVPLDTPAGMSSFAGAINASGDIAGEVWPSYSWEGEGARAFRYLGDAMEILGTLGGDYSGAMGIGDDGRIAGTSWNAAGNPHAFVFDGNAMHDLGTLGGRASLASAMSSDGKVAGTAYDAGARSRAFRYAGSSLESPIDLDAESLGYGINQAGDVTGLLRGRGNFDRAFVHSGGVLRVLGTLGGGFSSGHAINALGQVTGSATTGSGDHHAFLGDKGTMLDLGTLGGAESFGLAINVHGQVTGYSLSAPPSVDASRYAFLYTDGAIHNLNALVLSGLASFKLFNATGINDRGQIAASGCDAERCVAFRLDPVPSRPATAIEYHHAGLDHYFVTVDPEEIAALDGERFAGWTRTGFSFNTFGAAESGAQPVCRFFGAAFGAKSSHFYSPFASECASTLADPHWTLESSAAFYAAVPAADGSCGAGLVPVYRLYNDGRGGAPNHRYTIDRTMRERMIAQGWVPEGIGSDAVQMCSPI
jgi:probable HAF family extracellular repeat protein